MGIMMMSLVVGKMIVTLILDGLFQGKLLNLIIGILMKMNLSQAEADVIYQNIFRANRDVFQWIGFMLLFLVRSDREVTLHFSVQGRYESFMAC